MHKAGFINIIGSPNVGKSTLMNQLVGEKLSIITNKAQTTRHRIHGIVNHEDYQIVFSDTPGIVDPAYKLHESMLDLVRTALVDADVLLVMTEMGEKAFKNNNLLKVINELEIPILLLINKIDVSDQEKLEATAETWKEIIPKAEMRPISALHGFGVKELKQRIIEFLPESPPFYNKEDISDKNERFFVSEIIREKIFIHYKKEIPYATEVTIESFKELEDIIHIRAEIFVERDTQKGILIGHEGKSLKRVGTEARKDIEKFFGKKVFLDLHVKVDKDWRTNDRKLKKYGYIQK